MLRLIERVLGMVKQFAVVGCCWCRASSHTYCCWLLLVVVGVEQAATHTVVGCCWCRASSHTYCCWLLLVVVGVEQAATHTVVGCCWCRASSHTYSFSRVYPVVKCPEGQVLPCTTPSSPRLLGSWSQSGRVWVVRLQVVDSRALPHCMFNRLLPCTTFQADSIWHSADLVVPVFQVWVLL